jgi:translation initiation factor IF-2
VFRAIQTHNAHIANIIVLVVVIGYSVISRTIEAIGDAQVAKSKL